MNRQLYVKSEKGIVDRDAFDKHVPAHLEYIRSLRAQGRFVESGYWTEEAGGMMLFEAASFAEAQQIVEADPLIANGCVTYRLRTWNRVAVDESGETTEHTE